LLDNERSKGDQDANTTTVVPANKWRLSKETTCSKLLGEW
jgi:hypothetical protein